MKRGYISAVLVSAGLVLAMFINSALVSAKTVDTPEVVFYTMGWNANHNQLTGSGYVSHWIPYDIDHPHGYVALSGSGSFSFFKTDTDGLKTYYKVNGVTQTVGFYTQYEASGTTIKPFAVTSTQQGSSTISNAWNANYRSLEWNFTASCQTMGYTDPLVLWAVSGTLTD